MKKQTIISCMAVMTLLLPVRLSGQNQETTPLESITVAEMRDHIFFLASDYMKGRVAPSPQFEIAASYVASQFAEAGLETVNTDLPCMNGYFQEVPFERVVVDGEITWTIQSRGKQQVFKHVDDFKILEDGYMPEAPLDVVFAGYGIHEPEAGWDDFKAIDIKDKMVVVMSGAPEENGQPVLPPELHEVYSSMRGLQEKAMPIIERKPAAIVLALDEQTAANIPFDMIPSAFADTSYIYAGGEGDEEGFRIPTVYLVRNEVLEALFDGQKSSPAKIAEEGLKKYHPFQLKRLVVDTRFPLSERKEVSFKNVVGMVKGTDPELGNEVIVVGAHLDHVTDGSGRVMNGADDNASGSAGVMEIAEAVAMDPPRRTVVFVTYTAEEMGLHGSQYFVHSGLFDTDAMKFNVNLDMIGRTTAENRETGSHYVVAAETWLPQIEPFIEELNTGSLHIPLIYDSGHSGSSDHASFNAVGIPAFFFFSGTHEDLHQPGDDPEKIEYDKAVKLSMLACRITLELANMDEVPAFVTETVD